MAGEAGEIAEGVRLLSLTSALPAGMLRPVAFQADEALSQPFSLRVELVSAEKSIDPDRVLHKPMALTVHRQHEGDRSFHGMVRSFIAAGRPARGQYAYTAEIVPRLWFMGQTSDCRIFQGQKVADILTTLCGEVSQPLTLKIFGDKPVREYITQYNETDLTFLTRLLEAEGYHYYFAHSATAHTLIVTDTNQGFPAMPKPALRVVFEGGGPDVLTEWRPDRATAHGKIKLLDYDPVTPSTKPTATKNTKAGTAGAGLRDVFHWPAHQLSAADVTARAGFMIEAAEAGAALFQAAGETALLSAGSRFTLVLDPYTGASSTDYVLRRISHFGQDDSWLGGTEKARYGNQFTAFPLTTPWRQPLTTPRPIMGGVYAGIVLGPEGTEIHSDEYGRVKIQMFFDHRQETQASAAVWARIVQPWAGNRWGWQHLPRVGTEVAVCFMDGDPDRPVVMGGLYNGEMKPVFAIPDEQTKSGFRSRSSKGGGVDQCSELSFDDATGAELLFMHAERDMTVEVQKDQTVTVDNDQALTVKNNRTHKVTRKETTEIGDSQTNTVKNGRKTTVNAGGDALTVELGDIAVKASAGAITIEAMQSITLKVGGSTITIDQMGVKISGMIVSMEGKMQTSIKGLMTDVGGDAMLTVKGAITMIN